MYDEEGISQGLILCVLPDRLAVCRLAADAELPDWAQPGDLLSITRTRQELSIVCAERWAPPEVVAERGWRALQVQGPLDFTLVGVLASLAQPLAQAGISLFALSTFDTDYLLVKEAALERASAALRLAGHTLLEG